MAKTKRSPEEVKRTFDYDRRLLPHELLAEREAGVTALEDAIPKTGLTVGYPAWNLLYYSLRCAVTRPAPVVVETGTNQGYSTIVLAQALEELGATSKVVTCDVDPEMTELARANVEAAGLAHRVDFRVGDSLEILAEVVSSVDRVDFAFLDGDHSAEHVFREFQALYPKVRPPGSTVYFDNTTSGGVAEALDRILDRFGGNLVHFSNCSWSPPGNAIWQPRARRDPPPTDGGP